VIIGRSMRPWWKQVLLGSVLTQLLRYGQEFDLHIIAATDEERP
jgi:K+-sensing histidine kinase KdpD